MLNELVTLFDRDLDRLLQELNLFRDEAHLWQTTGTIKNAAGNLCLHLVGNLNNFIGKNLGNLPYTRDRDAEFSRRGVPKQNLVEMVEETKHRVHASLTSLPKEQLDKTYVENVLGYEMTTGFFLLHLAAHLSYHLGQINYIRRALE
jgi:uncharacterized damage-inducible protein DinB